MEKPGLDLWLKRSVCFFALALGATCGMAASNWDNPGERYSKAYKAYLGAACPIGSDAIKHFVYLAGDRGRLRGHAFLGNPRFTGAQIMYAWKRLEPSRGSYDFSIIEDDLDYLKVRNRKLFVQLQDATFDPNYKAVPDYLLSGEFNGGALLQHGDNNDDGWTAKRWNPAVQQLSGNASTAGLMG